MSATKHLGQQWEQGKLFLAPSEIVKGYHPIDADRYYGGDHERMWGDKLNASMKPKGTGWGSGVYDGLKAGKLDAPITTSSPAPDTAPPEYSRTKPNLNEGHHRVAAGLALEQQGHDILLPVLHTDYRR